jgi:hypothetical protein
LRVQIRKFIEHLERTIDLTIAKATIDHQTWQQ